MVSSNPETKTSGGKRGLIIAFIIILLAINGVQLWISVSKTEEIEKKDMTIKEQKSEISNTKNELDKVIQDLEQKKRELAQLGADTARLSKEIMDLKVERTKLAKESRLNKQRYEELLAKIDEANRLRDRAEADVSYWKSIAARLDSTNKQLQYAQEKFIDSLKRLNLSKEQLAEKVALASVLKAENMKFEAINNKGKVKDGQEFKVKAIEKLRISFNIAENKIARVENKEIYLRLNEPDGSTLFDLATGGGMFTYEGKEIPFTLKTDVLFDNKKPEVGFVYLKGGAYKPGKYTVELYSEGYIIGTGTFTVK